MKRIIIILLMIIVLLQVIFLLKDKYFGGRVPVFNWNVSYGKSALATSSPVNATLSAAEVCDNAYIKMTPTSGNINVTLPTAANLISYCLSSVTKKLEFYYVNNATAATTTTLIAGSNIDLESDDSSGDIISQNGTAFVSCLNLDNTNVACTISPYTNAD